MARVNVDDFVFIDARFKILAKKLHLASYLDAIGRCLPLWNNCTERESDILTRDEVAALGDSEFLFDALIFSSLATKFGQDGIRIKGVNRHCQWIKKLRNNGEFGKLGGRPKKNPHGLQTETPLALALDTVLALAPAQQNERAPDIVEIWNKNRSPAFQTSLGLSTSALKSWFLAWAKNPKEAYWVALIKRAAEETWLADPKREVPVTLAWFLKNHDAIELGEYDKSKPKKPEKVFTAEDFR